MLIDQKRLPIGWLTESSEEGASGYVEYTKWGASGYKFREKGYFSVRKECEGEGHDYGLIEEVNGSARFCTLNPEHGAYVDGNTVVHTYHWDYCAPLSR